MKKVFLIVMSLIMLVQFAYADNSERVKELIKEAEGVWNRKEQAVAVQRQCDERISEIRGAIRELQTLDVPKPKKEAPVAPEQKPKATPEQKGK